MSPEETLGFLNPDAQITITGRNVEVPDHFQDRVHAKLAKIGKLDPTLNFFHVELTHEPNPRREAQAQRIQITATGKGHLARAEADEDTFYSALDVASGKLERSLRKVKARREIARSGHRAPKSTGHIAAELEAQARAARAAAGEMHERDPYAGHFDDIVPGQVVRRKEHPATPRTVDEALSEMELVGHDFYLFIDKETNRPSVVYRRHAFDYGLISLADTND